MEIKRDEYLNDLIIRKHNGLIKIITGIRRSGKSYLLNKLFYEHLLQEGILPDHIIKFAFDSADDLSLIGEDFINLSKNNKRVDPNKFINFIDNKIEDDEQYYLLLDEVQNLDCFEAVLNGYMRKENLDIYVTGSNSKFLSSDVITEFRGRGDQIHIMPLSFSEFFSVYNGEFEQAFNEYILFGGLPSLCSMKTKEQKTQYLKLQIKDVYLKDIVNRYNLENDENIGELLDILASGISTLVNPSKLSNAFKSIKKVNISNLTISKYIQYLEDSFMISISKRYDIKGKRYINTPFKIYFEDIGLRNARLDFRQIEITHIMENIIYNELRYRGYNIDVGVVEVFEKNNENIRSKKQYEVDFVCNLASKRYYIQSAYKISDDEKRRQEVRPFDKINDSFKKIIITYENIIPRYNEKGYLIIGIKDFLLNKNSLEF